MMREPVHRPKGKFVNRYMAMRLFWGTLAWVLATMNGTNGHVLGIRMVLGFLFGVCLFAYGEVTRAEELKRLTTDPRA